MDKSSLYEKRRYGTYNFPLEFFETKNSGGQVYINLHWHRNIEILLIHSGTCTVTVNRTDFSAVPGDIFIINQEELHRICSEDPELSYGAFIFPMASLEFSAEDDANKNIRRLIEGRRMFPEYISADDSIALILRDILNSVLDAGAEKFSGYELFIKSQLIRFVSELVRHGRLTETSGLAAENARQRSERLKHILSYINKNCSSGLTLETMAKEFHFSKKYFSKYFIAESGQSFTEYLNCCRIEKACVLLKNTDYSVLDIALESGYGNISYFIRIFSSRMGCTPLKYRKKAKENN